MKGGQPSEALSLLSEDPKLAWVKDSQTGGYPIHQAAWKVGGGLREKLRCGEMEICQGTLQMAGEVTCTPPPPLCSSPAPARPCGPLALYCPHSSPLKKRAGALQMPIYFSILLHKMWVCLPAPLLAACLQGYESVVLFLASLPGVLEQRDGQRDTALAVAQRRRQQSVVGL